MKSKTHLNKSEPYLKVLLPKDMWSFFSLIPLQNFFETTTNFKKHFSKSQEDFDLSCLMDADLSNGASNVIRRERSRVTEWVTWFGTSMRCSPTIWLSSTAKWNSAAAPGTTSSTSAAKSNLLGKRFSTRCVSYKYLWIIFVYSFNRCWYESMQWDVTNWFSLTNRTK